MAYFNMLSMNLEKARSNLNHIPFLDIEASDAETQNWPRFIFGKAPGRLDESFFGARE